MQLQQSLLSKVHVMPVKCLDKDGGMEISDEQFCWQCSWRTIQCQVFVPNRQWRKWIGVVGAKHHYGDA